MGRVGRVATVRRPALRPRPPTAGGRVTPAEVFHRGTRLACTASETRGPGWRHTQHESGATDERPAGRSWRRPRESFQSIGVTNRDRVFHTFKVFLIDELAIARVSSHDLRCS